MLACRNEVIVENQIKSSNEFGPFTPQELEKVVDWLKLKNLLFEIGKDQKAENAFKISDGQNIVHQAEFRTETYLAQIFTVQVQGMNSELVSEFHQLFRMTEKIPERFLSQPTESAEARMRAQQRKKMIWAWIAAIIMGGPMILSLINILFKGE
jgi:hypothetical protein